MGILNVTPDSFSDGGLHFAASDALEAGRRMLDEGADILDVGGESTRPGAEEITAVEEIRRVLPVVEGLVRLGARVSIDTMKSSVARAALAVGAAMVNDVTALSDPAMAATCAEAECEVCLMHMQGSPRTMQLSPTYSDVVGEVREFLLERTAFAQAAGIKKEQIWLDPGIGFGKTMDHNLTLLRHLDMFVDTGYPILIGISRKSFIGKVLGRPEPLPSDQRLEGTLAAQAWAQIQGAKMIRAHDVKEARGVIDMLSAIKKS